MSARGFRYPLQPVLLTRQWDLDARLQDLQDSKAQAEAERRQLAALEEQVAGAHEAHLRSMSGAHLSVQQLMRHARYLDQLSGRVSTQQQALDAAEQQRAAFADQAAHARRRVDAVEKHRDDMLSAFTRARASADYKQADDHWASARPVRSEHDDHA